MSSVSYVCMHEVFSGHGGVDFGGITREDYKTNKQTKILYFASQITYRGLH